VFPREESYGLTSQIRRAAVSAATSRMDRGERQQKRYLRFLYIARGSLMEVGYIHLARRLGYLSEEDPSRLQESRGEAARALLGLIRYWQGRGERQ
jgi:four helix bundle protein